MDKPVLQNSTKFPAGYGDFALQSSDNVVCHFPRYLLEYMSPVFKDMFSIPNAFYPMGKPPKPSPLKLTENSAVIEALLEHIDPKSKRGLPIEPDVILDLLEAAQKYQISTITKWFVGQVGLPQIDDSSETPVFLESFIVTHPRLTLNCALRFDFPSIGKLALKELAGCPASIIQLESEDLPSRVYKYQCQLREVRIERYRRYISELSRVIKQKLGVGAEICGVCCGGHQYVWKQSLWNSALVEVFFDSTEWMGDGSQRAGGSASRMAFLTIFGITLRATVYRIGGSACSQVGDVFDTLLLQLVSYSSLTSSPMYNMEPGVVSAQRRRDLRVIHNKIHKLPMDQSSLKISEKYPPGYGDFVLQCSDNTVCYFPRYLLEYMSPVFKDMFSLPAEAIDCDPGTPSSQSPLKLTEGSAVIEALLEHIDPKSKRVLPIYPDIILGLLDAAQKYQISTVTEWFTEQAGVQQINTSVGLTLEPFTSLHPNLAPECALRFDFQIIGQLALRELAGTPSSMIKLESTELASRVYNHTCQLREVRVERYRRYISQLSQQFKFYRHMSKPCHNCISLACQWTLNMERAIVDSPRWDSFIMAYESAVRCGQQGCDTSLTWSSQLRHITIKWSEEAKKAESELPEWPF